MTAHLDHNALSFAAPEATAMTSPDPTNPPASTPTLYTGEALRARVAEVRQRIEQAAKRSGQNAASILLVAVTKYAGVDQIRELLQLGVRDFGENHVQQLLQRASAIEEHLARQRGLLATPAKGAGPVPISTQQGVRWHMIGHLQRNKAKKAMEVCRLVHSMDSLRLAEEIQAAGLKLDRVCDVLIQVNSSGEESKFGCAPAAAGRLAEEIMTMANVRIRGLMTMAPYHPDPEKARPVFARTRELFEDMRRSGIAGPPGVFNILSMGMSGDYEVAISEGANLVRVGSALVGEGRRGPGDDADESEEV